MKKKRPYLIVPVLLVLLVTACATTGSRYREGDNTGQETNLTVQDEQRLTQEALPEMRKDYPPAKDQALQRYINQLGQKIVRANNLEGNPYHYTFTVVDVEDVNAFALPAGTVFVTAPLIAMATNEAELAGVVSHEIGHIMARHTAERMYAMEKSQKKTWIYGAGGGLLGAALGYGLGRAICKEGDTGCLTSAATFGGAIGAVGGVMVQKYGFMANSREDEMEADRIGFRLAVNAGYDKNQVGRFYERLLEMEKKRGKEGGAILKSLSDALSTHPPSEERVKQMKDLARESPAARNVLVDTAEFKRVRGVAASWSRK